MISLSIRCCRSFRLGLAAGILTWLAMPGLIPATIGQANPGNQRTDRVGRLIAKLSDPDRQARLDAIEGLNEAIQDAERREAAIETRAHSTRSVSIAEIIDPRIIGALIGALKDSDAEVRASAAVLLGDTPNSRAVEPLIALLGDRDANVRGDAVSALGSLGDPRAVEPLIPMLSDPDDTVAFRAAEALGDLGDPRAVGPLIKALESGEPIVRGWAAKELGQIKDARAIGTLIDALKLRDETVTANAARALGAIGSPALAPLLAEIHRANSEFTSNVDDALSSIGGPAEDALIERLRDPDPNVHINAAYSLSGIADSRASDAVAGFEERDVVLAARNYISMIAKGEPGTEDVLIQAISRLGNKTMALVYINCGNDKLKDAGGDWAGRHGYYTKDYYATGSRPLAWHSAQ